MVRILGNSSERVKVLDLNDVIYYRQQKEYTDQEYENSRDLKKEIAKGRLTLLEKYQTRQNQPIISEILTKQVAGPPMINQEDIKGAVFEAFSKFNQKVDAQDIKKVILDILEEYKKGNKAEDLDDSVEILVDMPATTGTKSVDTQEIKRVITEVLTEHKSETNVSAMNTVLLSMIPLIADTVRQEVARIQIVSPVSQKTFSASVGMSSEFIPTINTEGMRSSVKGEERTASGEGISGSLEILKRLRKT
jgi:hypothetical protein